MPDDKNIVDLLRLVHSNSNLSALVKDGLRYSQISQLIEQAITEGYLEPLQGDFKVTSRGVDFIHAFSSRSQINYEGWIRPLESMRIKKYAESSIYLPKKRNIRRLEEATSTSNLGCRGDESSS